MSESSQEPLTVECPRCHTRFRARQDQLAAAGGQVRCGVCLALFDSSRALPAESMGTSPSDADADDPSPDDPSPKGRQHGWRRSALIWVGVVVALTALVFQVFTYRFDRWALDPQLRFIYEYACDVLGCELPDPSDQDVDVTWLDRRESLR